MIKLIKLAGELVLPAICVFAAVVIIQSFDMVFFDNSIFSFLESLVNGQS